MTAVAPHQGKADPEPTVAGLRIVPITWPARWCWLPWRRNDVAFRRLCRKLGAGPASAPSAGSMSAIVTARALVLAASPVTMHMTTSPPTSTTSVQASTPVAPATTYGGEMITDAGLPAHVDMNCGCRCPRSPRRAAARRMPYTAAVRSASRPRLFSAPRHRHPGEPGQVPRHRRRPPHPPRGPAASRNPKARPRCRIACRTAAQLLSGTSIGNRSPASSQHSRTLPRSGTGDISKTKLLH